jgi:hypothetical protein
LCLDAVLIKLDWLQLHFILFVAIECYFYEKPNFID